MRQLFLYGELAEQYGPSFTVRANTVVAAVRLMEANFKGKFMRGIIDGTYRVVAGNSIDDEHAIHFDNELVRKGLNLGSKDLHIIPVPAGSGGSFRIVLGIALIAAAFAFAPAAVMSAAGTASTTATFGVELGTGFLSFQTMAMFGASLALGGIASLLTPVAKVGDYSSRETSDERASYLFNGAVNRVEQGGPVPLIYGRMRTGSVVISGGIKNEDI